MASKNITLSIDEAVLEKFDEWRAGKPRGEALRLLLASAPLTVTAAISMAPRELGTARAAEPDVGPTRQALKQAVGRAVLKETETYVGVPPAEVVGDDVRKQEPTEEVLRNREEFYSTKEPYISAQPVRKYDKYSQVEEYPGGKDPLDQTPEFADEDTDQRRRR